MQTRLRVLFVLLGISGLHSIAQGAVQVTNGGFETGNFSGWTLTGNPNNYVATETTGGAGPAAHSGTYGAILAPEPTPEPYPAYLEQVIHTSSGTRYDLTFWLATPRGTGAGSPSTATASWDGIQIFSLSDINSEMPYQQFTFSNLLATSSNTSILFGFTVSEGYWFLDDVSVAEVEGSPAVPEPATLSIWCLGVLGCALTGYRRRNAA